MIAIRTAGVVVAAGLIVGCQQQNRPQPQAAAPEPAPIQAAEQLRQSLVRANPDARVGIVAATLGRFAAVRDVPAGNVAENATVQVLDPNGEVVGYGIVRAVKDDSIHVLYLDDARRGPSIGDLVMPASDAGVPMVEEMPAAGAIEPAPEAVEPTRLPPRRPADDAAMQEQPEVQPDRSIVQPQQPAGDPEIAPEPAPTLQEETQPGDFQPAPGGNTPAALPPVDGDTDAAQPAPDAPEPAPQGGNNSPGDTNNTASEGAPAPAEQPAPDAVDDAGAPAPEAGTPAPDAPAPDAPAPDAGAEAPDQNK